MRFLAVFFAFMSASLSVHAALPATDPCNRNLIGTSDFSREMANLMKAQLLGRMESMQLSVEEFLRTTDSTQHLPELNFVLNKLETLHSNLERIRLDALPDDIVSTTQFVQQQLRDLQVITNKSLK